MSLDERTSELADRAGSALHDMAQDFGETLTKLHDLSTGVKHVIGATSFDYLPNGTYWYVGTPTNLIPLIQLPIGYLIVRGDRSATSILTESIQTQTFEGADGSRLFRSRGANGTWSAWTLVQSPGGAVITTTVTGLSGDYTAQLSRNVNMGKTIYSFFLSTFATTQITGPITFTLPNQSGIGLYNHTRGFLRIGDRRYPLSMLYNSSNQTVTITAQSYEDGVSFFKPTTSTFPVSAFAANGAYVLEIS